MIDGFDGERHDVEEADTDWLWEDVRPQTVACMVGGETPGRSYWHDQLADIDWELQCRRDEGEQIPVEHPLNVAWRNYVAVLMEALHKQYRVHVRHRGVHEVRQPQNPGPGIIECTCGAFSIDHADRMAHINQTFSFWKGLPQTLPELTQ